MTHTHIPTLPATSHRHPDPKRRANVPADSFDPLHTRAMYQGRHVKRVRDCAPDWPSDARCTGGLRNENGKRLTHCRSIKCPRHQSDNYAEMYARHATDSFIMVNK